MTPQQYGSVHLSAGMTMREFCNRWFPLAPRLGALSGVAITTEYGVFGSDYEQVPSTPIFWTENTGIAQRHPYVVECWLHYEPLRVKKEPRSEYLDALIEGYDALDVRIVEHGVGEITRAVFFFRDYLKTMGGLEDGAAAIFGEHYVAPHIIRPENPFKQYDHVACPYAPGLYWHLNVPEKVSEELLKPIERYIETWTRRA